MPKLNNNRGFLLISALIVAGVLMVLSGAYVSNSFVQSRAVQRQKDSLQAFYGAEKGAEYVFMESQNHGWEFATHKVADSDLDEDGKINDLIPKDLSPTVTLKGASINADGCYEIDTPQSKVEVKVYNDPNKLSENIILSRAKAVKGDSLRIIKNRISHRSLYKYFLFFPVSQYFGGSFNGKNKGGIHVNGDIILGGANFTNMSELSASGYIYYNSSKYRAPYNADDWDTIRDGSAPMLQVPYPPYNYYLPSDVINNQGYFFSSGAKINGISIPKILPEAEWAWDKYSGTDAILNPGGKAELPVTFVVPLVELARVGAIDANDYWVKIYGSSPSWVNTEWWEDKVYGNDRASNIETAKVTYTNSQYQADAWRGFMKDNALDSIVKEKNSGGQSVAPLNIELKYPELAKSNGLYVDKDGLGNTEVYLNSFKQETLPCWVEDNVQFFNSVRPHIVSTIPVKENVIQFDMDKFVNSCPDKKPNNNIIYVANKNLRLVNAAKLPSGGITVVSPYNVYLKGNYNIDAEWQPSAVITNSLVYTLSEDFNDPQVLPESYNYKEYPYSLDFQGFLDQYASGSRYPVSLPPYPETGITPAWVKTDLTGNQQKTLLDSGELYYDGDNESLMANRAAKDTVYNVAIAAPYNPYPYSLERWSGKRTVEGSFIRLEKTWSSIRDVPGTYKRQAVKGSGGSSVAWDPTSQYNYEEKFADSGGAPSGDFMSGSQARWEVVSDFIHDI